MLALSQLSYRPTCVGIQNVLVSARRDKMIFIAPSDLLALNQLH